MISNRTLIFRGDRGEIKHLADQVECNCGCKTFFILQIVGQPHPHYMCSDCETPYCPYGENCEPPLPNPDERCPWCLNRMRVCQCTVEDVDG